MSLSQEKRVELIETRRLRRLRISFGVWREFVRGNLSPVSSTDCPDDLEVVGLYQANIRWGDVDVVVWSESFSQVPEPEELPLVDPFVYSVEYVLVRSGRPAKGDFDGRLSHALHQLEDLKRENIPLATLLDDATFGTRDRSKEILRSLLAAIEEGGEGTV